ncbi:hypothetical protein E4U54_002654 [Claviceps lovelessii]|nr:hypothetical protein E4U54_002654 [Claviceps lovelessii]
MFDPSDVGDCDANPVVETKRPAMMTGAALPRGSITGFPRRSDCLSFFDSRVRRLRRLRRMQPEGTRTTSNLEAGGTARPLQSLASGTALLTTQDGQSFPSQRRSQVLELEGPMGRWATTKETATWPCRAPGLCFIRNQVL